MPTQKLDYWTIMGKGGEKGGFEGVSLKYNKEISLHERVPVAAYQEIELMFDACFDSAKLMFAKTMVSPPNTKPENRKFELLAILVTNGIEVQMAEDKNAKSS